MGLDVIDQSIRGIHLVSAVLLYGTQNHGSVISPSYATIHPIDHPQDGSRPVIRAGRPADKKSLASFATALMGSNKTGFGLLPGNVLSIGANHVAWWVPPKQRSMHFKSDKGIGTRSGMGLHPGLIFAVAENDWYVFAVNGDQRPTAETPLFNSPYFNVWKGGKICTGNVRLPNSMLTDRLKAWESAFFDSNFTHPNFAKAVRWRGGIHKLWADILDGKFDSFPEKALTSIKDDTVGKLITRLENTGNA